jgi:hypothetical protein
MATDPKRPLPPVTPLIDRLKRIERENQDLVDFVKWLRGTGRLTPVAAKRTDEEVVAAFRGIDLRAVAAERKAVTDYAAAMQTYWAEKERLETEAGG